MSSKRRRKDPAQEISAGGVVVRGLEPAGEAQVDGAAEAVGEAEVVVIVPTRRAPDGSRVLALPKGHIDPGENALQAAAREVREETGMVAEPIGELGKARYWYRRDGRTISKAVSFYLFRHVGGDTRNHDDEVEEVRWIALRDAQTELTHTSEREMVVRALARLEEGGEKTGSLPSVQVLNFYSTIFADELKRGRKTATIRLGNKSGKYRKNQAVLVTIGYQYSPRERIFEAVIDQVEVMKVADLSPRDIKHDNPEFRRHEELIHFLEQIYGREVSMDDTVTVVRFSQILDKPTGMTEAMKGFGGAQN